MLHNDDQIRIIMLRAKSLNLSPTEIDDLLLVSCRSSKPIPANELMQQMDNWVNVVQVNGHPYRFLNLTDFQQFGTRIKSDLSNVNVTNGDIRVQGSSLRTPNASDVDIAVVIGDQEFNNFLRSGFGNNQIRNKVTNTYVDVTNMTNSELTSLAQQIKADVNNTTFNAKARTFEYAFSNRKISSKTTSPEIIPGINNLKNVISSDYPHLNIEDISTITPGSPFDLEPFMNL